MILTEQEIIEAYHLIALKLLDAKPTGASISLCPFPNASTRQMRSYDAVPEYFLYVNGQRFTYTPAKTLSRESAASLNIADDWNMLMQALQKIEDLGHNTATFFISNLPNQGSWQPYRCSIQQKERMRVLTRKTGETRKEAVFLAILEFARLA
jgi:hypothetical protein